ncbi:peptide ABC transporter ATP-binding protein [Macrococcus hajekii]|nr:ATP-binding cassette domain-containing protein [Macrococcus hajekii]GGB07352.1 peptide ABC transporter ATP-binding protein [Macrococcus hajekii]
MTDAYVVLKDVSKFYRKKGGGSTQVLHDVTFDIRRGEVLGIVGESGSGKSTLGKLITKIEPYQHGSITFDGQEISKLSGQNLKRFRRRVQMIFQDPDSSLNPRMKIKDIILEGVKGFDIKLAVSEEDYVDQLLSEVGLSSDFKYRYSSELSGGQKQRVGIARALAVEPELLIADEPISALDVSVQAQVLNLLRRLKKEKQLTYVFIGHDLNIVRYISDRIVVLYNGALLETGSSEQIFSHPQHPYTKRLLDSSPVLDPSRRKPASPEKEIRPDYGPVSSYIEINPGHFVAQH